MKVPGAAVLGALVGLAGCGKAAKGPPVEVRDVQWKVGADCAPPRIVVDVNTTGNAQIEINGRRTGADGLLAVQTHVEMASDHIPESATEIVVQAVDHGTKGPAVTVALPPRPRPGLHLRGQTASGAAAVGLTCGEHDEAFADAHLDAQGHLTASFTACDVASGTVEGGTVTVPAPGRIDLALDVTPELARATLQADFPLTRKVALTGRGGQPTACTTTVLGWIEETAFGGGRAVPWASVAGPDAAVLVLWRDHGDHAVHSAGDPWQAPLTTIGVEVDLAETDRVIPGEACDYSQHTSVPSVRRVYRATAFEARTGRRLGEREIDGAQVECPLNMTLENGVASKQLVGDVDADAVVAWAHTLR